MKKYLHGLCFELTRRCNMKCEFCCKGDAQSQDITPEIIDKALDEFSDYNIFHIRVNGGEPLLNKQGLLYLIDEIIRREFKVCQFIVFTNGTVQDQDIKAALVRVGEHCRKCALTDWGKNMIEWERNRYAPAYEADGYTNIIVSTSFHNNGNIINDTIAFYNDGVDPEIMCAVNQSDSYIYPDPKNKVLTINIEGNAETNLQSLCEQGYKKFLLYSNRYSLIDECNDSYISIQKTITISANGNVVSGCTQSYDKADYNNICNILECNGNLCSYINDYSWEYPLSKQQAEYLMNIITYRWLYDRGIKHNYNYEAPEQERQQLYETFGRYIEQVAVYVEMVKDIHKKYRTLSQQEARELTGLLLAQEQTGEQRRFILERFCDLDEDNSDCTLEEIQEMIMILQSTHYDRLIKGRL